MSDGNPTSKPSQTETRVARNQFCSERRTKDKIFTNRYPKTKKKPNRKWNLPAEERYSGLRNQGDSRPINSTARFPPTRIRNEEEAIAETKTEKRGREGIGEGVRVERIKRHTWSPRFPKLQSGIGSSSQPNSRKHKQYGAQKIAGKRKKNPTFLHLAPFPTLPPLLRVSCGGGGGVPLSFPFFLLLLRARKRGDDIARQYPPS